MIARQAIGLLAGVIGSLSISGSAVAAQSSAAVAEVTFARETRHHSAPPIARDGVQDSAAARAAAAQRLTVELEDVSIATALAMIERQSHVQIDYSSDIVPAEKRVTASLVNVPVLTAIRAVLRGTDIGAEISPSGHVMLTRRPASKHHVEEGSVTGRVTDGKTGYPVTGVTVLVQGTQLGGLTDEHGRFRIEHVPVGAHTLEVRRLGYAKLMRDITVAADQAVDVNLVITPTANMLNAVVVTGTVIGAEQKELPNPITVIGSDVIQQKNITRVDELFRGDVPGVVGWDQGPYDYYADIGSIRGSSTFYFNAFKVYIDGVEMSDPLYISTIDPNSIDHIEIVRGPQASTLYGSEALAGVMQIFTKKGYITDRPVVSGKVAVGAIDSKWVSKTPISQDYSLSVSGGQPDFSYNLGGTYYGAGAYVPEAATSNGSGFGSLHSTQGKLTIDLSGRYYIKNFGWPLNPILANSGYTLWSKPRDEHDEIRQQTLGLHLNYAVSSNWQHNFTAGYDHSEFNYFNRAPRFTTPADSFMEVSQGGPSKVSLAYNTSIQFPLGSALKSTVTAGFDHWEESVGDFYVQGSNNSGLINVNPNGPLEIERYTYDNTGYFSQVVLGLKDVAFLTLGLRGDQNGNFGADYGTAWAPHIGASYIHGFGGVTMKLRASYGKAIRPPDYGQGQGFTSGPYIYLANTHLAPEEQVGAEGGVELYFGNRASLQGTYYNQTAIDLIDQVLLQYSQVPNADTTKFYFQSQNVGRIKNKGWEFQGQLNLSPVTVNATYSITDSRVGRLSPTYTGDLQVGDKLLEVPYTSGGLTLTYAVSRLRTNISASATYIGHWTNYNWIALYGFYYGGQPFRGSLRDYWMEYPSMTKYNITIDRTFGQLIGFLQVNNISGITQGERDNTEITAGRWTVLGFRFRY